MFLAATQTVSFLLYLHHFTKYSFFSFYFCLGNLHLRMPLISHFKWPLTRSWGGLITCLQSSHKMSISNGFSNKTWNVGCTLTSSSISNLYMSFNTYSTIENGAPILDMNFSKHSEVVYIHSTFFCPRHTSLRVFWHWLAFRSIFGVSSPNTWSSSKFVHTSWLVLTIVVEL